MIRLKGIARCGIGSWQITSRSRLTFLGCWQFRSNSVDRLYCEHIESRNPVMHFNLWQHLHVFVGLDCWPESFFFSEDFLYSPCGPESWSAKIRLLPRQRPPPSPSSPRLAMIMRWKYDNKVKMQQRLFQFKKKDRKEHVGKCYWILLG